ncbi:hypothetical protein USB125703_01170 [Pseudoclavibacter triregionum]|nr:hypothetical protein USB125703_01170 [Pseudoclavibacter triregionum]
MLERRRRRAQRLLTAILALLIVVPLAIAALHPGFAATSQAPERGSVWVANDRMGLIARVNDAAQELDASLAAAPGTRILQAGLDVFLVDPEAGVVGRLDPARVELRERITVPPGAEVAWNAGVMSILDPASGRLWGILTDRELEFDPRTTQPLAELGAGAQAVVAVDGAIIAYAPGSGAVIRIRPGSAPERIIVPAGLGEDVELTAVGDRPVLLDRDRSVVILDGRRELALSADGVRIQQPGPRADTVVVATADALLAVPFSGDKVEDVGAAGSGMGSASSIADPVAVSRPLVVGPCVYGAWAALAAVTSRCAGQEERQLRIRDLLEGGELVLRENGGRVVANNLANGRSYLADLNLLPVEGWESLVPPSPAPEPAPAPDALAQQLAARTGQNHAPELRDDVIGVRPGETTTFSLLANDLDSDGDVLEIAELRGSLPASIGAIEIVDGGRAVQVRAAPEAEGSAQLGYIASDGRPGGVSQAGVTVRVIPPEANAGPVTERRDTVAVELGQSIEAEVLSGWSDPDGDPLTLVAAEGAAGTLVRFTSDGRITATASGGEPGLREISYRVYDGIRESFGTLGLDVHPAGTLAPVAEPDAASRLANAPIVLRPLENDRSPSGQPLRLASVRSLDGVAGTAVVDPDRGELTLSTSAPGTYYLEYTVAAGPLTTIGLARVDVLETAGEPDPPVAAQDVVHLAPGSSASVDLTANDLSPSGRVLGVASIDLAAVAEEPGLAVALDGGAIARIEAVGGIAEPVRVPYVVSDGVASSPGELLVLPAASSALAASPRAEDDIVRVRAGELATLDPLANDVQPDGLPLRLDPRLLDPGIPAGSGGLAVVAGQEVRIQAPPQAGTYTASYGVTDSRGAQARGRITIEVSAPDPAANRPPSPAERVVRATAGQAIRIELPLSGADPDGDATTLASIDSVPSLGAIREQGPGWIVYAANPSAGGTEELGYSLADGHGGVGTGTIRIGVIPPADGQAPGAAAAAAPVAVDDVVRLRPDRSSLVPVLDNDRDPAGLGLALAPLPASAHGLGATVEGDGLRIAPPAAGGFLTVPYEIRNTAGETARANVHVLVDANAPLAPPLAADRALGAEELGRDGTYLVDARAEARSLACAIGELEVRLPAPPADPSGSRATAIVDPAGRLRITPGAERTILAYELVDPTTGLAGTGFLIVPARR